MDKDLERPHAEEAPNSLDVCDFGCVISTQETFLDALIYEDSNDPERWEETRGTQLPTESPAEQISRRSLDSGGSPYRSEAC